MLVLTRKSNQSIMIGDNIEVSVLAIMGEKVRIGIQADRNVPVFRKEVYLEIQAERGNDATDGAGGEPAGDGRANAGSSKAQPSADGQPDADPTDSEPASAAAHDAGGDAAQNGRREVDAALRSIGESQ
jgi:carbon storage regulator